MEFGISNLLVVGYSGFIGSAAHDLYTLLRQPGCLDVLPASGKAKE